MVRNLRYESELILKDQYKNLKGELKLKADSIITLYRVGNIHNINTARYAINKLLTPTQKPQQKQVEYLKTILKYTQPSKHQQKRIKQAETIQSRKKENITRLFSKFDDLTSKAYLIDILYFDNNGNGRPDLKNMELHII